MKLMNKMTRIFCLAAMLLCATFAANGGEASAMPLSDLQGTYRVVDCNLVFENAKGLFVNLRNTNKGLKGFAQNAVAGLKPGEAIITDVHVNNGKIECTVTIDGDFKPTPGKIEVYQHGATLKVSAINIAVNGSNCYWIMKRI